MPDTAGPRVRFAVAGVSHPHIFDMVAALAAAGGEPAAFWGREPEQVARLAAAYPAARVVADPAAILEDPAIALVLTSDVPDRRAALGMAAMQHGKDFLTDKPGFTSLEQLAQARQVQQATGRIYAVYYGRLASPAVVRAGELAAAGAIGRVIQTVALGPHRARPATRPPWFFEREHYGGILADLGVHDIDEFLFFTGSTQAEIVAAQVGNFHYPEHPELEDFGDATLRGDLGTGYLRVDWYSPEGLDAWGDTRLLVLGTEGYLEVRQNVDLAGRPGGEHLFLADGSGVRYIDCRDVRPPYPAQLLADVAGRTQTAMAQEHCFLVSELALRAQAYATRLGNLA